MIGRMVRVVKPKGKGEAAVIVPSKLKPNDCVIVLFGATGDLAKRKLLPGLFHLAGASLMPDNYHIIGCAPVGTGADSKSFVDYVRGALDKFSRNKVTGRSWKSFSNNVSFVGVKDGDLTELKCEVERVTSRMTHATKIVFLAVPPSAFVETSNALGSSGIVDDDTRLVIEKPFGYDLDSARSLNGALHKVFKESQIYRIDHFLGREMVQNILAFRFANGLFEALWNKNYIEFVQIDVPETLTIEGRAGFYEATGAFRDMVVTHLFQMLGFLAMEPPDRLVAQDLHKRKIEVYDHLVPIDPNNVIYGQYKGYKLEPGVNKKSKVETFVSLKAFIDNDRWSGVPWYLRTGKAMAEGRCTVTLGFKESPAHMFEFDSSMSSKVSHNKLVFELSDPGSVTMGFLVKRPGPTLDIEDASLSFRYDASTLVSLELEAYERLFHDVMLGEHLLFNTANAIERLWEISTPLLASQPDPLPYEKGSWGPSKVNSLISPYRWHLPVKD